MQCRSWPLFRLIPHRKNLSPSSSWFNPSHCSRPSLLEGKLLQSLSSGSSPLDCVQVTLLTTPSEGSPLPFYSQHLFWVSSHLSKCSTASPPCLPEATLQVQVTPLGSSCLTLPNVLTHDHRSFSTLSYLCPYDIVFSWLSFSYFRHFIRSYKLFYSFTILHIFNISIMIQINPSPQFFLHSSVPTWTTSSIPWVSMMLNKLKVLSSLALAQISPLVSGKKIQFRFDISLDLSIQLWYTMHRASLFSPLPSLSQ